MKSIGGYVVAALALAALGGVALAGGLLEHRIARADEAMASLDFVESAQAYDELEQSIWYARYVPWVAEDALKRIRARRAAVRYWDGDYDALLSLTREDMTGDEPDPDLLFIAANAMYRLGQARAANPQSMLRAFDAARDAYQAVLRQEGSHPDAAFNYEYMVVVRDQVAKGVRRLPSRSPTTGEARAALGQQTLHGRRGGPPPGRTEEEFKVYVPEDRDERAKKGTTPGGDQVRQRKG